MYLAMFSCVPPGAELLGIALATVLAVLAIPVVALFWWRLPPRRPFVPAAIYLVVTLFCTWGWPIHHPISDRFLDVGFGLLTPWSVLYLIASISFKADIVWGHAVVGALMNAALIYGAAALARWRKLRVSGGAAG